ncbi:MAG: hypothetical protein WAN97_12285, partial [Candidatus Acidiferrales bacterium]
MRSKRSEPNAHADTHATILRNLKCIYPPTTVIGPEALRLEKTTEEEACALSALCRLISTRKKPAQFLYSCHITSVKTHSDINLSCLREWLAYSM